MAEEDYNDHWTVAKLQDLDRWNGGVPWKKGHELTLRASGGASLRDDRRISVAAGHYTGLVSGNRNAEISGNRKLRSETDLSIQIHETDSLRVEGNADLKAGDRMVIGTGHVTRRWEGAMARFIGMEGVICGGAFLKSYLAGSLTIAPLATGDIYGGGVHAAGVRVNMSAMMGYRSCERVAWQGNTFVRSAGFTLEPIAETRTQEMPKHMAMKAARIGLGLCPFIDILLGVLTLVPNIASSIYGLVKNWKKPPPPPKGPPRVHNRTYGVATMSRASDKIL